MKHLEEGRGGAVWKGKRGKGLSSKGWPHAAWRHVAHHETRATVTAELCSVSVA